MRVVLTEEYTHVVQWEMNWYHRISDTMEKVSHKLTVITGFDSIIFIHKLCGPYQKLCANIFHNQVKAWIGKQHISQVWALLHLSTKSYHHRCIFASVLEVWKSHCGGRTPSQQFANEDGQLLGVSHWLHNVASYMTSYEPEQRVVWRAYAHTVGWMGRSSQPYFWILTKHTDEQRGPMCFHAAGFFSFLNISYGVQLSF